MIGDVGRTEFASELEEGAAQLYQSLQQKLLALPDHLEVYPGAFSGSFYERAPRLQVKRSIEHLKLGGIINEQKTGGQWIIFLCLRKILGKELRFQL
ncbi:MBL fold metallo-hydrolase [Paenibacillus xylanivorans]|uniref:Uncharacterized protein n=1 Tax=Paenibacillus xylanivorans TaxID=1705561 RepID=A0A0N0UIF7_9BACL|nr:hypothetical protein [Paenibacillus xylanivorans]KOY17861.1 hypothetical protein AMS66_03795 [Paenibacillus xylanivorans]